MRDTISDSDCKGFYVALRKEPEKRSAVEHGTNKRGPKEDYLTVALFAVVALRCCRWRAEAANG